MFFFIEENAQAAPPATESALPSIVSHKIQVSDPALAKKIEALGGRLIADYGGYRLYETPQISSNLLANTRIQMRDHYNVITLNAGHLDTRKSNVKSLRKPLAIFQNKHLHLVQFAGPVQSAWRNELLATGVQIVSYIPENTYLVYGDASQLRQLQTLAANKSYFQWEGSYINDYKIHPLARDKDGQGHSRDIGTDFFDVQLVADDAANVNTLQLLNRLTLQPFKRQEHVLVYLNVVVKLNPADLKFVAEQPDVVSILPYFPRHKLDERQDQIAAGHLTNNVPDGPGYLAWLASVGFTQAQFTASHFAVDISDSGVDNGTTSPAHFGLYVNGSVTNASRVIYNRYEQTLFYPTNSLAGCDGHGTINAHIIAGYDNLAGFPFADSAGYHYGLGVCPFVSIGSSVIFDSVDGDDFYAPIYANLQSKAYHDGARISNNSWSGVKATGVYDSDAQKYDALVRDAQPNNSTFATAGNQPMVIVFSAGNDGPDPQSIDTPATAKNILSVGAADGVQLFGGSDKMVPDSEAQSANEVASFSSRGPCVDGRIKPDILAPGTHISGGVVQATNDPVNFPFGLADSCFDGSGVSGGFNSIFWPTNQQFYTASSGTSQAAPCVSGGCALVLQYFLNHFGTNLPSPAMTKAYLINSARYLTGATANDTLPSNVQGMGEMNLGMAFDGTPRILRDQVPSDLFTNSGQLRSVTGVIADTNKPFRITLAWTDAPGGTAGNAYNNDLDLAVTVNGTNYLGNVFNGAFSTTGGTADGTNNVESIFLPAGVSGNFVVTVNAANINSCGVPDGVTNAPNQDFALVVYNATPTVTPVVAAAGTTLVTEGCYPTNGVIDPGETVTVSFALQDIGTANTTNLVATLQTNSGVLFPSAPQTYGALTAAGTAVSQLFTFTANGSCGDKIIAKLQLQDGAKNLGTVSFTFQLGQLIVGPTFMANFDDCTPPAIPSGWSASATNGGVAWLTTTNAFDTASNSIFVLDATSPGISDLISPVIPIITPNAQLTFMNNYDLEALPVESQNPSSGYDGGVLEIQIDNGAFSDILAAGGSFATGGYTTSIDTNDIDNPFVGRQVWSGNSGGFISTVVNLPASCAGHNIRLKFRCGTDTGNPDGGTGWYIDTLSILDGAYSCCSPLVAPRILNPQVNGATITFSFQTVLHQTYSVQYKYDLSDPDWNLLQSVTGDGFIQLITDSPAGPQRFYRIVSP